MKNKIIFYLIILVFLIISALYLYNKKLDNAIEKKYLKTFLGKISTVEIQCRIDSECVLRDDLFLYCVDFKSINKNSIGMIGEFNSIQDEVNVDCQFNPNGRIKGKEAKCIKNTCSFI